MRLFARTVPGLLSAVALVACGPDDTNPSEDTGFEDTADDSGLDGADSDVVDDATGDADADAGDTGPIDAIGDADVADVADVAADTDGSGSDADANDDADTIDRPPLSNLIITEFMAVPCAAAGNGDWFEIANVGDTTMDIRGMTIVVGTDETVVMTPDPLRIRSGEHLVIAAEGDSERNGGLVPDYAWAQLRLGSDRGSIEIHDGDLLLDRVDWDFGAQPAPSCRTATLSGGVLTAEGNDDFLNWCLGDSPYGEGDLGTPGFANPVCAATAALVEQCRTQPPAEFVELPGTSIAPYGRVRIAGITDRTSGIDFDSRLGAEFGWGPVGTAPTADSWTWVAGSPSTSWTDVGTGDDGWDEYFVPLTLDMEPGRYEFAWRFGTSEATGWTLCDLDRGPGRDGSENGYASTDAGRLTVISEAERCAEVVCDDAPATDCASATEVREYAAAGTCRVIDGATACVYAETLVDCDEDGQICLAGACAPAAVVPAAGDVLITELMPRAVAGTDPGEWFELTAAGDVPISLAGCSIAAVGGSTYNFAERRLEPGDVVVYGASNQRAINGGIDGVTQWTAFTLPNTAATLRLSCGGSLVDQVSYATAEVVTGESRQLDVYSFDSASNDPATAWCISTVEYGNVAYRGTPGMTNAVCPATPRTIDRCRLEAPTVASVVEGNALSASARVLSWGVTDRTTGVDAAGALRVQLGVGPLGSLPAAAGWTWVSASGTADWDDTMTSDAGWDSYTAALTLDTQAPGDWDFAFRASGDGGATWTYCDRNAGDGSDGSEDGYDPTDAGALTVEIDVAVCEPNPCEIEPEFTCLDATTVQLTGPTGVCTALGGGEISCDYVPQYLDCDAGTTCIAGRCIAADAP
jgi:hypothetical protein